MRANLVPPADLMDQHLLAEWRELKMVPPALQRSIKSRGITGVKKMIPTKFTLGKGHISFWYNKLDWLSARYDELTKELLARGFDLQYRGDFKKFCEGIPKDFFGTWDPSPQDVEVSKNRIAEKIAMKPHWYRKTPKHV